MAETTEVPTNELVVQSALAPEKVFVPGGVDPILDEIAAKARANHASAETPKGRKEIASLAHKVARSKTLLDGMGKALVAEWKQKASAVDEERRKIRTFLDDLKDEVRKPLTDYEAAEEARVGGVKAKIAEIADMAFCGDTSDEIGERLEAVRAIDLDETVYQEMTKDAALAKDRTARLLSEKLDEAVERERQEAERAAREKAEAEARAKQEAEESERRQREWEEQAKAREEAAAKRAATEAEERHRAMVERERAEAERKRQAEEREADRLRAEEARRISDQEHRRTVNREAMAAIQALGLTEEQAKAIVLAVINGEIPHVSLSY